MDSRIKQLIDQHDAELAAICEKFGVERLSLFGSAASDDFDEVRSDLDFVVEFKEFARAKAFDNYFGLLEQLTALFGRPVDLVTSSSLRNPYLIRSIEQSRQPVYGS